MGISASSMRSTLSIDRTDRQLFSSALNQRFDPTAKAIVSNHETDKQAEDNTTWLYEYKALLNSKLTTLTTALSSAYTTDLDVAMGSTGNGAVNWQKNAMQGISGTLSGNLTIQDPGAARTAYAYLMGWGTMTAANVNTGTANWAGTSVAPASQTQAVTVTLPTGTGGIQGTTTFLSGGRNGANTMLLDTLLIDRKYPQATRFSETKPILSDLPLEYQQTPTIDINGDGAITGADAPYNVGNPTLIGNNFQRALWKFFQDRQNVDLINFGLLNDVIIVGTSSLPTGSQVQGSVSLTWTGTGLNINQERFAAFYHS